MPIYIKESNASCQVLQANIPKRDEMNDEVDVSDGDNKDTVMGTTMSAPTIGKTHSHALPLFNPLLWRDTDVLLAQLPKLEPLQMNSLQTNFIAKTMNESRDFNANKRQKTETEHGGNYFHDDIESLSSFRDGSTDGDDDSIISFSSSDSSLFDIFDELEAHPNAIQLVASSGGLITHWNKAFSDIITHKSSSSLIKKPITIFELVDSKSLPLLYSMLAMSLHNVPIVEVEIYSPTDNKNTSYASFEEQEVDVLTTTGMTSDDDLKKKSRPSSPSHLSITLSCKPFHNSSTRYNVTIVFVDAAPMKRCFIGILTPRSTQQENCSNGDIDDENCLSDGVSFCASASTNAPSNGLTKNACDIEKHREDCTQQRIESLNEEHGAALAQIPCGKVLRIDDDFLCQILFGSK
ncbi:hypothetical protein ACHAW5_007193 [Stephanodiscus triporus]|uniref:Uncharacterized protein n=1 Tax=Stephanodiscus triporus TaxID=2934178 RepID=A0ABD3MDZ8_9STRA